jgi:hypothetical protein
VDDVVGKRGGEMMVPVPLLLLLLLVVLRVLVKVCGKGLLVVKGRRLRR